MDDNRYDNRSTPRRNSQSHRAQSTTVVYFRAGVMLITLVGIPAVAFFKTPAPKIVSKLFARLTGKSVQSQQEQELPPGIEVPDAGFSGSGNPSASPSGTLPIGPAPAYADENRFYDSMASTADQRAHRGSTALPSSSPGSPANSAPLAGNSQPGNDSLRRALIAQQPERPLATPEEFTAPRSATINPPLAGNYEPQHGTSAITSPPSRLIDDRVHQVAGTEPSGQGTLASAQTDPFTRIEKRLRELGATSYRLESWGKETPVYRFTCEVPIDQQHISYTRPFEAIEPLALQAMQKVLVEVENWRQADSQRATTTLHGMP